MNECVFKVVQKERTTEYVMDDFEVARMEIEELLNQIEEKEI